MREKKRDASVASSRRASLESFLSAAIAMSPKPDCAAHLSASPLRTYTTSAAGRLCAPRNTFGRLSQFAQESLRRRAMLDQPNAEMRADDRKRGDGDDVSGNSPVVADAQTH